MNDHARSNLSRHLALTSFVGRQDALSALSTLLDDPNARLVNLLGPGGVGKTRLLQEYFASIKPVRGIKAIVLLENVTNAATMWAMIAGSVSARQATIASITQAIGEREVLLALDNVEQLSADLVPIVTLLARCPNLRIIVTSRHVLHFSPERIMHVNPLEFDPAPGNQRSEAAELLIKRALDVNPHFDIDLDVINDICRALDGMPLAIELVAARARLLSATDIRDRLARRVPMLSGGPHDAPARHRSLDATLDWSLEMLPAAAQILFARLSVGIHGLPIDAIGPICDPDGELRPSLDEVLTLLIDHSLVRVTQDAVTGTRVSMLQPIHDAARERLRMAGEAESLTCRHADWYWDLAIQEPDATWSTGTDALGEWTNRHAPDLPTFDAVLEHIITSGRETDALLLATTLVPFWMELARVTGFRWLKRLERWIDAVPARNQILANRFLAINLFQQYRYTEAIDYAEQAVRVARSTGDDRLLANALSTLGDCKFGMGDITAGEALYREVIDLATPCLPHALYTISLADWLISGGDLDAGEQLLRHSLDKLADGPEDALCYAHLSYATLQVIRGKINEAAHHLKRSLRLYRTLPVRRPENFLAITSAAGQIALERGNLDHAARLLGAMRHIEREFRLTLPEPHAMDIDQIAAELEKRLDKTEREHLIEEGEQIPWTSLRQYLETTLATRDTVLADPVPAHFTPREQDVFRLLIEGMSNDEIAGALFVSARTVSTHLTSIYAKLNVSTRAQAIAFAHENPRTDT